MEAILSPYLLELRKRFLGSLRNRCMSSLTTSENMLLNCCAMSCEATLVLFNWVRKILTLTLNRADTMILNSKRKIFCTNMMRAFGWMRLNILCSFQKIDKLKNHGKENPLPNIPDDILQSFILPKIPLESLLRFKCVSNDWKETISCPRFESLLREQLDHDQIQSFALFSRCGRTLKKVQKCDGLELVMIEITSPMNHCTSSFHASCNGFLCLDVTYSDYAGFVVGNPITGEWDWIPYPILSPAKSLSKGPGLAVDLSKNPPWYRLVVLVSENTKNWFYVFSSDTGKLKISNAVLSEIDIDNFSFNIESEENSVFINGLLYWMSLGCKLLWFGLDRDEAGSIVWPSSRAEFYGPILGSLKEPGAGQMRLTCTIYLVSNGMVKSSKLVDRNQWIELVSFPAELRGDYVLLFPYMGGKAQYILRNKSILVYEVMNTRNGRVVLEYIEGGHRFFDFFAFKMNISPLPKCINR